MSRKELEEKYREYSDPERKLCVLMEATRTGKYAELVTEDGTILAYADCWVYLDMFGREDVDAIRFIVKDGTPVYLPGEMILDYKLPEELGANEAGEG